jgi:hypothetical protein
MFSALTSCTIRIVGAGPVGLAVGYLLTERGHSVFHCRIRGGSIQTFPVRSQVFGTLRQGTYSPRFIQRDNKIGADINIFAAAPNLLATFLPEEHDRYWSGDAPNLILASVLYPDWQRGLSGVAPFDPVLAFPVMSCEYDPSEGLCIVTDMQVEVHAPKSRLARQALAASHLNLVGLTEREYVSAARFSARYVLTATVYSALLAIFRGRLSREDVSAALLLGILDELSAGVESIIVPGLQLDFPTSSRKSLAAVASLIASPAEKGDLLADNLRFLLTKGEQKMAAHLKPLQPIWAGRQLGDGGVLVALAQQNAAHTGDEPDFGLVL